MSKRRSDILWAARDLGRYWNEAENDVHTWILNHDERLFDYLDHLASLVSQPTYDEKRFHA